MGVGILLSCLLRRRKTASFTAAVFLCCSQLYLPAPTPHVHARVGSDAIAFRPEDCHLLDGRALILLGSNLHVCPLWGPKGRKLQNLHGGSLIAFIGFMG